MTQKRGGKETEQQGERRNKKEAADEKNAVSENRLSQSRIPANDFFFGVELIDRFGDCVSPTARRQSSILALLALSTGKHSRRKSHCVLILLSAALAAALLL